MKVDILARALTGERYLFKFSEDVIDYLVKAKRSYYIGKTELTDSEFDRVEEELRRVDPTNDYFKMVGNGEGKIPHGDYKMLSLGKLSNINSAESWMNKIRESKSSKFSYAKHFDGTISAFGIEWKYDGVSLKLRYHSGQLVQALTRGNGSFGEDVTTHAMQMPSVPSSIPLRTKELVEVIGEAIMPRKIFDEFYSEKYANPRNFVAGLLNRNHVSDDIKNVDFVAYGSSNILFHTEAHRIKLLKEFGFRVADFIEIGIDSYPTLNLHFKEMQYDNVNRRIEYETDGIVIKVNEREVQESIGDDGYSPNWATCVKFESKKAETIVEDLTYTVGQTGKTTFMLKVKPVNIGGTTVRNVSVNSWRLVEKLQCGKGSKVIIERAGDVIPHLHSVLIKMTPDKPTNCKHCSGKLVQEGAHLYCHGVYCEVQNIGKLSRWVGVTGVKYWGSSLILKLFHAGIKDPRDLYELTPITMVRLIEGVSLVRAKKLLDDIQSRSLPLWRIIVGMGFNQVGTSTAKRFANELLTGEKNYRGISHKEVETLQTDRDRILEMKRFMEDHELYKEEEIDKIVDGILGGKKFVFTGKMQLKRSVMHEICRDSGGVVVSSVTRDLDYLVQADPESQSSKSCSAEKLGVSIISDKQFMHMTVDDSQPMSDLAHKVIDGD